MKNQVNKGFFSYLLIFLVIVAALVLGAGAVMMLSPNVKILGYQYVNETAKIEIANYNGNDISNNKNIDVAYVDANGNALEKVATNPQTINFSNLNRLVINTNGMEVNVVYFGGGQNRIDVIRDVKGYAKSDTVTKLAISKSYQEGVLTINVLDTVPGLTLSNNSKINVYLKERISNTNIEINSKVGNLNFATKAYNSSDSAALTINAIEYKTEKGSLTIGKEATIKTQVVVQSSVRTNVNVLTDLNLYSKFSVELKEGSIKAKNIDAYQASIAGEVANFTADKLLFAPDKGLTLKVKRGDIEIKEVRGFVEDVNMLAENLFIKIGEISGNGYLKVDKLGDMTKANKGDVEIEKINGEVFVKSSSGSVEIKEALNNVNIETVTGKIYLETTKIEAEGKQSNFKLKTKSGDIFVNASHIVDLNTIDTEKGKIEFNYLNNLSGFEVNATSSKANSITFQPENKTFEEKVVVGYPTTFDAAPEVDTEENPVVKKVVINGERIFVSAVSTLKWFLN